jgi:hypothetical protein
MGIQQEIGLQGIPLSGVYQSVHRALCAGGTSPFGKLLIVALYCALLPACNPKKPTADLAPAAAAVPPPATNSAVPINGLDDLFASLATRVSDKVNGAGVHQDDFVVTPIPLGQWNVGTVLQAERSVPVTFSACRPAAADPEVNTEGIPNLFPTYTMKRDISLDAGLDAAVFKDLLTANGNVKLLDSVLFEIDAPATTLWSDVGIGQMLASAACRGVLKPGSTYRLVRGIVIGRRQFSVGVQKAVGVQLEVPTVAHFKAQVADDGSTVKFADEQPEGFLAVLSQFQVPPDKTASVAIARPAAVQTDPAAAKTFVQRDSADDPAKAKQVIDDLRTAGIPVESQVEKVPSNRMPSIPQVRYFRAEDRESADKVLGILRSRYPEARLVALRFPSPPGQLEVWLQKIRE